MKLLKADHAEDSAPATVRLVPRQRASLSLAVSTRRMTLEEQRRFKAAFDVFLAELVRQHLDRTDGK